MSAIVPFRRSAIRRPLPSTGSCGSVPRLHRYYEAFRLPAAHPAALRCLRLAVPLCALVFRSRRRPNAAAAGQGLWIYRLPLVPVTARRRQALPGSWRTPVCSCPALRPRWDLRARPSRRFGAAFRGYYNVGSHDDHLRGSITRPVHSLSTLRHHDHSWPRKTRFRLLATLCRAGLGTRWVPPQGFRNSYISSSLPRLFLAHSSPGETPAGDDCLKT